MIAYIKKILENLIFVRRGHYRKYRVYLHIRLAKIRIHRAIIFRRVKGTLGEKIFIFRTPEIAKKSALIFVALLLLFLLPFNSVSTASVKNQEFFIYHTKDLINYARDSKSKNQTEGYYIPKSYETEISGELFGKAKGRNLILVQMESMQNMVIGEEYMGQEITPCLNSIIASKGTLYFDNFYSQLGAGNTSDAEFAVNQSLFGVTDSYTYQLFENNYFHGLPKILKEEGYDTAAFHGYLKEFWNREKIYPVLGFNYFYSSEDYKSDNIKGLGGGRITGISDIAFFEQSVEKMKELKQPFYSFLITLSSHHPFHVPETMKGIIIEKNDEGLFGDYLNAVHYLDKAIGQLFSDLKEEGLYENSIIILYGDHFGISVADITTSKTVSEFLAKPYTYDEMNRVPLIIHIPGFSENERVSISGGQLDLLPTISYLMGEKTLPTVYLGQNLLTAESGFVPIQMHMIKGSFIKDDIVFEMSKDGVFKNSKAWNRKTLEPLDIDLYYNDYKLAKTMVETSEYCLTNDATGSMILEGKDLASIYGSSENIRELSDAITVFTFSDNSPEELELLDRWLTKNGEEVIAVSSNEIFRVLRLYEDLYSGRVGEVGSIQYVEGTTNKKFVDKRNRIVILMENNTYDFPKLEYIGYHSFIISPERLGLKGKDLEQFIDANCVKGFLIEGEDLKTFQKTKGTEKINYYIKENNILKRLK